MKRMFTALTAVSVLGAAAVASAASHSNYRGGRGYTRATTMRTTYTRPVVRSHVRVSHRPAVYRRGYVRPVVTRVAVRPRFHFDYRRAGIRAAAFARYTSNMWARARSYRYWSSYQLSILNRLQALNAAANAFMSFSAYTDIAAKQAELARIEAEFAYLRANGAFLAPYGSFAQLASSIGSMRAQLNAHIAATAYAPPAPMPQPEPQPVSYTDGTW